MLVVETIAKIRRAHFVLGKPIKAICRELKVSRKVVGIVPAPIEEGRFGRLEHPSKAARRCGLARVDLNANGIEEKLELISGGHRERRARQLRSAAPRGGVESRERGGSQARALGRRAILRTPATREGGREGQRDGGRT